MTLVQEIFALCTTTGVANDSETADVVLLTRKIALFQLVLIVRKEKHDKCTGDIRSPHHRLVANYTADRYSFSTRKRYNFQDNAIQLDCSRGKNMTS